MTKNVKIILLFTVIIIVFGLLFFIFKGPMFSEKNIDKIVQFEIDQKTKVETEKQVDELQYKLEIDPENNEIKKELSHRYYLLGDIKTSEGIVTDLISKDASDPRYYVDLGNIYLAKGDIKNAEESYKKAIEINEQKNVLPEQTSIIPSDLEKIFANNNIAEASSEKSPIIVRNIPTPYIALARLYSQENKELEKIKVLERGISIVPTYPDFYLMLSEAYNNTNLQKAKLYRDFFEELIKETKQS